MFPKTIRIWHWLNAIAFIGILVTVFLRELWMSKEQMAGIIAKKLTELNTTISNENAVIVAKAIRSPMWEWHLYFGYFIGALILFRLLLALKKIKIDDGRVDQKMKMVRLSHDVVMIGIVASVLTGILGVFGVDIGMAKDSVKFIREIHENISWVLVAFVPLHIIGVFVSDNIDYKGIVSKIISG